MAFVRKIKVCTSYTTDRWQEALLLSWIEREYSLEKERFALCLDCQALAVDLLKLFAGPGNGFVRKSDLTPQARKTRLMGAT